MLNFKNILNDVMLAAKTSTATAATTAVITTATTCTVDKIITGDFNINPYDDSCIGVQGFHALHVYEETERKSRTVSEEEFFMFLLFLKSQPLLKERNLTKLC